LEATAFLKRFWHHVRWKSVTELLSRAISLIFIFMTTHLLGDQGYGAFSLPLAWAGLWALTLDWGTQHLLIRELGEQKSPWTLIPQAMQLKLLATLTFGVGLALSARSLPQIPGHALAAAGLWSIAQSWNDSLFALLNAYERFQAEAVYRNLMRFVLLLPQVLVLYFVREVWTLLWVSALTQSVLTLIFYGHVLWQLRSAFQSPAALPWSTLLRFRVKPLLTLWRSGLAFWWFNVAWLVYLKLDLVMLPSLLTASPLPGVNPLQTLGWYQGAIRCYEVVALMGYILSMSLYPLWVRLPQEKRPGFWLRLNGWLWPASLGVALMSYALAPVGLPLLLGATFQPAIGLFQILSLSLPFVIFNQIALHILSVQHRQQLTAMAATLCLILNGLLNFYFIPHYAATAAAWSTVAADILLSGLLFSVSLLPPRTPAGLPAHISAQKQT
jgi:O-antigen/teichoic acid export membrane protein